MRSFSFLQNLSSLLACILFVPILYVVASLFYGGTQDVWQHLLATVMPRYVGNTLILCVVVGLGVGSIGVVSAYLTSMFDFPARRVLEWALVLPMSMPAYVLAYMYTDFLQFVGPLQTALRSVFHWQPGDYWFPDVRSVGGACAMFILVLYPYVYLLARTNFLEQSGNALEAGRSLGLRPWAIFWRVSLPLARPAIVAGVAVALMETLADYGTVSYFAVQTFTTGIYRAWFSLGDRIAATQLAAALLGFVVLLLFIEKVTRGNARFATLHGRKKPRRQLLTGWRAWLACAACVCPLFFGFILPAILLLQHTLLNGDAQFGPRYLGLVKNSVTLAAFSACCAVILAVLLVYRQRVVHSVWAGLQNRLLSLGYAVPGGVIAVGILIPLTRLDQMLADAIHAMFGFDPGLLLTGGIGALIYAYLVRYLTVALQGVDSGLAKITTSMDDAARSLGYRSSQILWRVHWPMLRGSLLTVVLLVFVDVMKELPATLVMRPFDFDTLATQAYNLAADERLAEASTAALSIVGVGLLPVILLSRKIAAQRD